MSASFTRLEDFRVHAMNLKVECVGCGHTGVLHGPKLWRWFAVHRWDGSLAKIGDHLRCSACRLRPTVFMPTSGGPTLDFGPRDERGWQDLIARLR
jgi:hypothetical protein